VGLTERVTPNLQHHRSELSDDLRMYSFVKTLRNAEHTCRYSIRSTKTGWEVREELDSKVVRQTQYQDWHRVERARQVFALKFEGLRSQGWQETGDYSTKR
jgi:hypothetical protein